MKKLILLLVLIATLFVACSTPTETESTSGTDTLLVKCDSACTDTCTGAVTSTVE